MSQSPQGQRCSRDSGTHRVLFRHFYSLILFTHMFLISWKTHIFGYSVSNEAWRGCYPQFQVKISDNGNCPSQATFKSPRQFFSGSVGSTAHHQPNPFFSSRYWVTLYECLTTRSHSQGWGVGTNSQSYHFELQKYVLLSQLLHNYYAVWIFRSPSEGENSVVMFVWQMRKFRLKGGTWQVNIIAIAWI